MDVLERLLERLDKLQLSAAVDINLLGPLPINLAAFEALPLPRQSAARAVLKSFEQIEDQLSRLFRAIPRLSGEDTRRWFARDHADYMERFGVLDDAAQWSRVVKLRNLPVHDYPLDPHVQFERLVEAVTFLPLLTETHKRLRDFIRADLAGKLV